MENSLELCAPRRLCALLLIYLLVVRAAADCPDPPEGENMVLTEETLLMNDFPEGRVATLECARGYFNDTGTGISVCTNGIWSKVDLECRKKDCGIPKPQANMNFNLSAGTLFGATIGVYCDKGYKISGMSYRQCYDTGWFGRGRCNVITCEVPPEVANGKSSWDAQDEPKYGETIQYICDKGYTLVGAASIMCSERGQYDSQPPDCRGPTTETPTSTSSPATPTTHRYRAVTTTVASAASPSEPDVFTAESTTSSVASTTVSSFRGQHKSSVDYTPVVVSVIAVLAVTIPFAFFLHKYLVRKTGSYDTREDLKPELLQFQNL
ncbi:unnamed protein product [Ophioblennius macclurei]